MRSLPVAAFTILSAALAAFAGGEEKAPAPSKAAPDKPGKDWREHMGDIPFLVGREKGLKEVEFSGKPILYFYTATW